MGYDVTFTLYHVAQKGMRSGQEHLPPLLHGLGSIILMKGSSGIFPFATVRLEGDVPTEPGPKC